MQINTTGFKSLYKDFRIIDNTWEINTIKKENNNTNNEEKPDIEIKMKREIAFGMIIEIMEMFEVKIHLMQKYQKRWNSISANILLLYIYIYCIIFWVSIFGNKTKSFF